MDGEQYNANSYHTPVLVQEVVKYLPGNLSGIYIDGTLGGGGHTRAILDRLNDDARLIGLDRDQDAVNYSRQRFACDKRVDIFQGNFGDMDQILRRFDIIGIDGLLLDLGVSSHQIQTPERGFSYLTDGPLDMRMDVSISRKAKDVISQYSEKSLADLFYLYGEEHNARRIARKVVLTREKSPIETTGALAAIVRRCIPERRVIKTLSRIFQSLRIEINQELEQLKQCLQGVYSYLKLDGSICVISYHSLEDRMVKRFFKGENLSFLKYNEDNGHKKYDFQILTKKVIRPCEAEIKLLPTSRSAKLRAAIKKTSAA